MKNAIVIIIVIVTVSITIIISMIINFTSITIIPNNLNNPFFIIFSVNHHQLQTIKTGVVCTKPVYRQDA